MKAMSDEIGLKDHIREYYRRRLGIEGSTTPLPDEKAALQALRALPLEECLKRLPLPAPMRHSSR